MTTLLPAAMLAEEVEQILENTDPDQRWRVTAAQKHPRAGCLGEDPFHDQLRLSHYQSGRPGPSSSLQTTDPTGTTHKVM